MNKKIVAIFIPSYRTGGAEKALVLLANSFVEHFDEVHMLSTCSEGPLLADLSPAVKRIDFACTRYRHILFKLRQYYDRQKPDAILTSVYATGLVAAAARLLSRHKPVLLIGAHNSFSAKLAAPDNAKDKYLLGPLSRLFFSDADAVVSVSRGVAEDLARTLRLPPAKLHVIYNPVVSPGMLEMAKQGVDHPWLGEKQGRPYKTILAVGRLVPQKAFDVLLRAFRRLPGLDDFRLIIVGDGPQLAALKSLAQELGISQHVDFAGHQTNPYRFMGRADLFVLSSSWEGLGNVLIEAMACGCPVVSTDCPYGPAEILGDGEYGKLASIGSPESLAEAILAALRTPPDAAFSTKLSMRAAAFTDARATRAYVDLINRLLAQSAVRV